MIIGFRHLLADNRRCPASVEQLGQTQSLQTGLGYLQDRFSAVKDDLAGNINQSSAYRAGIGAGRQHRGADVFLERLKQKMTHQHHIIPGRVGGKPFEGQLFMAKILDGPIGQFVTAAFVITGHNDHDR